MLSGCRVRCQCQVQCQGRGSQRGRSVHIELLRARHQDLYSAAKDNEPARESLQAPRALVAPLYAEWGPQGGLCNVGSLQNLAA